MRETVIHSAQKIVARDQSSIEVWSTSTPLSNTSGVWSILIDDYSKLLYIDGRTSLISSYDSAQAILEGGQINRIRSFQYVGWIGRDWIGPHIEIICRDYVSSPTLITGTWNADNDNDGQWDTFSIQLLNQSGYSPVIVPEPVTLGLLSLGGLLIRKNGSSLIQNNC